MIQKSGAVIIVCLCIISFRCKDAVTNSGEGWVVYQNPITSLLGTIENWKLGTGTSICVVVDQDSRGYVLCGSSPVDSLGRFHFNFLTPPVTSLFQIDTSNQPSSIKITDKNAKISSGLLSLFGANALYSIGEAHLAYFQDNSKSTDGDFEVAFIYADRAFSFSGYSLGRITSQATADSIGYFKYTYDLHLQQGWNACALLTTAVVDSTVREFTVTDNVPGNGKYSYIYFGSSPGRSHIPSPGNPVVNMYKNQAVPRPAGRN